MVDINAENVDQVEILVSDKDDFYLGRIHLSLEKLIEPSIYGINRHSPSGVPIDVKIA